MNLFLWLWSVFLWGVHCLVVERHGHNHGAYPLPKCQRIEVDQAGEDDADELPRGHDCGEDQSAKLSDGVEEHDLATCGAKGEQERVCHEIKVCKRELYGLPELAQVEKACCKPMKRYLC